MTLVPAAICVVWAACLANGQEAKQTPPKAITPCGPTAFAAPPSDALVLMTGASLDQWEKVGGGSPAWKALPASGAESAPAYEVVPGAGSIQTKQRFGDVQIHVEFREPNDGGEGQGRGN